MWAGFRPWKSTTTAFPLSNLHTSRSGLNKQRQCSLSVGRDQSNEVRDEKTAFLNYSREVTEKASRFSLCTLQTERRFLTQILSECWWMRALDYKLSDLRYTYLTQNSASETGTFRILVVHLSRSHEWSVHDTSTTKPEVYWPLVPRIKSEIFNSRS